MPTTYTPNASNDPATYTLPSDLDNAMVESVNVAFRAIADKLAHNYSVFAQLAASNTFTAQQKISDANGFLEIVGNAAWKLMLMGHTGVTDGTQECEVRLYSNNPSLGGGAYFGALTVNAFWTGSDWQQQCNTQNSTAILFRGTGFDVAMMPAGSADWALWPQASGETWAKTAYALTDFRYLNQLARTRTLPLDTLQVLSATAVRTANGLEFTSPAGQCSMPIMLAHGCQITRVDVMINRVSASIARCTFWRTSGHAWTDPGTAPSSTSVVQSSTSSGGVGTATLNLSETINSNNEYRLQIGDSTLPLGNGDIICGVRVSYNDPGPRNY